MINRSVYRVVALLLLIAAFPVTSTPVIAQTTSIRSLAVNPVTNRIYAMLDNSVVVIDGTSNAVITTLSIPNAGAIAVNTSTNRIYVLRAGSTGGTLVSVIDGGSNTILTTFQVVAGPGGLPLSVAVTPATNRVYVMYQSDDRNPGVG
jgi:DNA-binding beta-propeller fold protein YncE